MQRTAQAAFLSKGRSLLRHLKLEQIVLVKFVFIGGVFCIVPCFIALAMHAAADWQVLGG